MARSRRGRGNKVNRDPAKEAFERARAILDSHPLFGVMLSRCYIVREQREGLVPASGWAVVDSRGQITVHGKKRASAEEWTHVLAHCLLHLGLGHTEPRGSQREWNAAACASVERFLAAVKIGRPPEALVPGDDLPARSEEQLYAEYCARGIPPAFAELSVAGNAADIIPGQLGRWTERWSEVFARGLRGAVEDALVQAADVTHEKRKTTRAELARQWFVNHFPLLGSLAATFELIDDPRILEVEGVEIGAVSPGRQELYINSRRLNDEELRFVLAHEMLHAGLRHDVRRQGRDPFLWNIACDYVINDWLVELEVGQMPHVGLLLDLELRGLSAEAVYDRITGDLRRYRKLSTLRGRGQCDIIEDRPPGWWAADDGVSLDEFYRSCMLRGLEYELASGRGTLPAGLVQEIRALMQPPIAWDVELAQWFDERFSPIERRRSYARPSRRQASTPDIPRPRYIADADSLSYRTFAVVLDTSASMSPEMLAKALGSIASYAAARDVPAARVVFCDAHPYDQGYMPIESIAEQRVQVKGRGGTVLQPAVDLIRDARDFPDGGPILIITDGECDRLRVRGDHAFLIPSAGRLPFTPIGQVFRVDG